jgi:uncharacterized protein (TIGR03435 family)
MALAGGSINGRSHSFVALQQRYNRSHDSPCRRNPQLTDISVFTAVQDQLGLKLESQKAPVEILVVDHMEKPTEN